MKSAQGTYFVEYKHLLLWELSIPTNLSAPDHSYKINDYAAMLSLH